MSRSNSRSGVQKRKRSWGKSAERKRKRRSAWKRSAARRSSVSRMRRKNDGHSQVDGQPHGDGQSRAGMISAAMLEKMIGEMIDVAISGTIGGVTMTDGTVGGVTIDKTIRDGMMTEGTSGAMIEGGMTKVL